MRIGSNYRLHVRATRPIGAPRYRGVTLAVLLLLVAAGAVALPALASSGTGSESVSVNVAPPQVKSISVSPAMNTYTSCVYATSTSTQLGFPNGACQGQTAVLVTNGSAPATILVNGADMIPTDNGTHWALCTPGGATGAVACSGPLGPSVAPYPGTDQYYETVSPNTGQNTGASQGTGPFQGLTNSPSCDNVFGGGMNCSAAAGQTATEHLAMTGPYTSSDPSSSFSTNITWTAS